MEASCCGAGGRKKRALSETPLLSKGQARSSQEQPTTHAPVIFPRRWRTWEAVNLPGTGLHFRCNSVFAQRGSCLIFFTGNPKRDVSVSPHLAAAALSLEAVRATAGPGGQGNEVPVHPDEHPFLLLCSPCLCALLHRGASSPRPQCCTETRAF